MKLKTGKRAPFRRRLEKRTDYKVRLRLLKSGLPRFVVRKGHNFIHIQLSVWKPGSSDHVVLEESSKSLRKLGWKGHCGNISAAYLVGALAAKKAAEKGISEAVLDAGVQMMTPGNAIMAAVMGARDAGLDIAASEEAFPDEKRVRGEHIAAYKKSDEIVKQFDMVKAKIMKAE